MSHRSFSRIPCPRVPRSRIAPSKVARFYALGISNLLLITVAGCQSPGFDRATEPLRNPVAIEKTTEKIRSRCAFVATAASANGPVLGCYAQVSVARPAVARHEFDEIYPLLFPIPGYSKMSDPFDSRYPNEKESRVAQILVDRFVRCVDEESGRAGIAWSALQENHFAARRKLLARFLEGEMSFGKYSMHIRILDSQLRAGVLYQSVENAGKRDDQVKVALKGGAR